MKATASKHIGDMMAAALTLRLSSRQTLCALADVELLEVLADRLAYPDRPAHPDRGAQVMFGVAAAARRWSRTQKPVCAACCPRRCSG